MSLKKLVTLGVVMGLLAGLLWFGIGCSSTRHAVQPTDAASKALAPARKPDGAPVQTPSAAASDPSKAAAAAVAVAQGLAGNASTAKSAGLPEWVRNPPDLGLSRVLTGEQDVFYDGRPRKVLGTKTSKAEGNLGQPVLLVRDETSGQIEYFQSGLQFRLTPGLGYAAFLRESPRLQPQFFNSDYATVIVDAASIADEFRKLNADPRVAFVGFLIPKAIQRSK